MASVKPPVGRVKLNAEPTVAVADASVPLKVGAVLALMVIVNGAPTDALPVSVAVIVTELTPDADGVPVMVPAPAFRLKPAGKPMAE